MFELDLIRDRFNQTFHKTRSYGPRISEGSWHGPSLLEALEGVDNIQAKARPIEERHTIWEIIAHCTYWMEEVTRALRGGVIENVLITEDWPQTGESCDDWNRDIDKLKKTHKELVSAIDSLDDESLDKTFRSQFGANYFEFSIRKMLHGISDHNLYHSGQISVLKT